MRNIQYLVDRGMAKFQVMLALLLFLMNVHAKYEHLLPEMKMNVVSKTPLSMLKNFYNFKE